MKIANWQVIKSAVGSRKNPHHTRSAARRRFVQPFPSVFPHHHKYAVPGSTKYFFEK
jgi:hypothetical protein